MAGKNKIESGIQLIYDDSGGDARSLCTDMVPGSLSINGFTYEEIGMTGACEAVNNYLLGVASLDISAQFYMNDTASTGAWTVLSGQVGTNTSTGYTLTIQFGSSGASPTNSDPELEGEFLLSELPVSQNGGAWICSPKWIPKAGETAPAWGTVSA